MNRILILWVIALMQSACFGVALAPTEAQSPEEQRKQFRLPPGFEIQLVLAEPDIGQPMNLNFDAQGRLWVTSSIEYPFPARGDVDPRTRFKGVGDHEPRDWLTVAADIDIDGKPGRITTGRRLVAARFAGVSRRRVAIALTLAFFAAAATDHTDQTA